MRVSNLFSSPFGLRVWPLAYACARVAALAEAFRGQAAVATLDVEAEPQMPKRYGVQTLPALLFFQDGKVVDQLTGVVDKADMTAKLHALTETSQA